MKLTCIVPWRSWWLGMTAPHRLRDLADVIELIRINRLRRDLDETLHPYVRDKYLELWQAAQQGDEE